VDSALKFYRVMAYLTGVMLLILCAGMVVKYGFGNGIVVSIVGPIHGFLYMVYLAAAFNLGVLKARWPMGYLLFVLLAGTIPFVSFIAERNVTHRMRQGLAGTEAA